MKAIEQTFRKELFEFTDYRAFLAAYLQSKRLKVPGFTLDRFAQNLGLAAPSSINKVLRGQRHPGPDLVARIAQHFQFNDREERYFRDLITLASKPQDSELRTAAEGRVSQAAKLDGVRVLKAGEFETVSGWYHLALRESLRLRGFTGDLKLIWERFRFPATWKELQQAALNLERLGLMEKDGTRWKITDRRFHTSTDLPSIAIRSFHDSMIENARLSLQKVAPHERYISGSTLAVRKDRFEQAKALIEKFQDEMTALCESDAADEVFQLNVQFFPLTQTNGEKK